MMNVASSRKHPVRASVLWALLLLVFYFAAGFFLAVTEASATNAMLIRAVCVFFACVLAVVHIIRSKQGFSAFGFNAPAKAELKKVFFFLPIIAMETVPLFAGFRQDNKLGYVSAVLACTLCVGFAEEIYFRGFILNTLKVRSAQFAIIVSSVIFGLTHLINIAGGAGMTETILQIFFAFFFGVVCAEILVITDSILPIMAWHTLHDFLAYTTNDGTKTFIIVGTAIQTVILIGFGIYLFTVIRTRGPERPVPDRAGAADRF